MKSPKSWVLVADSARARALAWHGPDEPLTQIEGFDLSYEHLRGRDIISDRPGRIHESSGTTRHAVEPHTDPVRDQERHFAARVIAELEQHHTAGAFNRLIIVAGPTMLGDLRANMSEALRAVVRFELAKDLTHEPNARLKDHLQKAGIF